MEEINNKIIQESFPEFKDTSPQMKREYQVLRAMSWGGKMSHQYHCEISETRDEKVLKAFREMGEKTTHV